MTRRNPWSAWTRKRLVYMPKPFGDGERIWNLQFGPGTPAVLYGDRLGVLWQSIDGAETGQRLGTFPCGKRSNVLDASSCRSLVNFHQHP